MEIMSCGGCGSRNLSRVLKLRSTPVADRFMETKHEAVSLPKYPLGLLKCEACTLVQLSYHVPDDELYGSDYAFFTGSSPALVKHFADYAAELKNRFQDEIRRGVIEIASNDGTLLQHFKLYRHLGIDPAGPATYAARAKGLVVYQEPFTANTARNLDPAVRGGLVIANNVLAHVRNPHDIVEGIKTLIGDTGVFVGEFQYLPDLLLGNNFDLVYHEHRYFYSLDSLAGIFAQHGMAITRARHVPTQGGSLRITAKSAKGFQPLRHEGKLVRAAEWAIPHALEGFQGRVNHLIEAIDATLDRRDPKRPLVGYGASAKSCTLLHQLRTVPESIVDVTPYKVGRFSPGLALPIVHPENPHFEDVVCEGTVDYLSLIGNYAGATLRRETSQLQLGNRFVFPLPYPVVI